MTHTTRRTRAALVAFLALALSLMGVLSAHASAQAPPKTTVSIRMVDAGGTGIGNVDVTAVRSGKLFVVGTTDASGYITMSSGYGNSDPITNGAWTIRMLDFSTDRDNLGTPYYLPEFTRTLSAGGENNLGTFTMKQTSAAYGRLVGYGSGRPLTNVQYRLKKADGTLVLSPAVTVDDATFVLGRLLVGSYVLEYKLGKKWLGTASFNLDTQGQRLPLGARRIVVKAKPTLTGVSPAKGKLSVSLKVDGRAFGSPDPAGNVTFTIGKKVLQQQITPSSTNGVGKATVEFTGLSKGSKTVSVQYTGVADVADFTRAASYVVK